MRVVNPKRPQRGRRERASDPTFRRTADHAAEEGLGGSSFSLSYRGDLLGFVVSTWSFEHGVHWRALNTDLETITHADGSPRAFPTRAAVADYLLDIHGLDGEPLDYDIHKGPRGGGEDFPDRRY